MFQAIDSHLMTSQTSPQEDAAKLFDEADLNKDGMSLGDFNDFGVGGYFPKCVSSNHWEMEENKNLTTQIGWKCSSLFERDMEKTHAFGNCSLQPEGAS